MFLNLQSNVGFSRFLYFQKGFPTVHLFSDWPHHCPEMSFIFQTTTELEKSKPTCSCTDTHAQINRPWHKKIRNMENRSLTSSHRLQ